MWLWLLACDGPDAPKPMDSATRADTAPVLPERAATIRPSPLRHGDPPTCDAPGAEIRWTVDGAPSADGRGTVGAVVVCDAAWPDGSRATADAVVAPGNQLWIVLDDQGTEEVTAYGEWTEPVVTPNLDALAAEGLLFRRAYASPTCSATRATLLTGRHAWRTGIGAPIFVETDDWELPLDEDLVPELLRPAGYTSVAIGKWHLSSRSRLGPDHPVASGFDHHAGSLSNLADYGDWVKSVDGVEAPTTTYATTDTVTDAVAQAATLPEPWFLYVALNAVHNPWHVPPDVLHTRELGPDPPTRARFEAMIEATDTELGRLLAGIAHLRVHTHVVVVGDNGTHDGLLRPADVGGGKGTVRETGVRVPLVVAGPAVTPGQTSALVSSVDLAPTALALAGLAAPGTMDGTSLLPVLADPDATVRSAVYTEYFKPHGSGPYSVYDTAAIEDGYKLIRHLGGAERFFVLDGTREGLPQRPGTPEEEAALERLRAVLAAEGPGSG